MRIGRLSHARWFRRGRPNRQAGRPPYPRESATLQSTFPNSKADAYPGKAPTGPRPAAEFWKAHDAHEAVKQLGARNFIWATWESPHPAQPSFRAVKTQSLLRDRRLGSVDVSSIQLEESVAPIGELSFPLRIEPAFEPHRADSEIER